MAESTCELSAPEGIRTPNLLIRSQMLYPLSYGRSSMTTGCDVTGSDRPPDNPAQGVARARPITRQGPAGPTGGPSWVVLGSARRLAAGHLDVGLLDVHVGLAAEVEERPDRDGGQDDHCDKDATQGASRVTGRGSGRGRGQA